MMMVTTAPNSSFSSQGPGLGMGGGMPKSCVICNVLCQDYEKWCLVLCSKRHQNSPFTSISKVPCHPTFRLLPLRACLVNSGSDRVHTEKGKRGVLLAAPLQIYVCPLHLPKCYPLHHWANGPGTCLLSEVGNVPRATIASMESNSLERRRNSRRRVPF
jgi:hypothetical protein